MADDLVSRATAIMMPQYRKDWEDSVSKKLPEIFWLKRAGAISYNQGGRQIEVRVRVEQGTPFGFLGGMEGHTPEIQNDYQVATAEWRGLACAFAITYKEKMTCKEPWQIIKLLSTLTDNMKTDFLQELQTQFYGSGTRLSNTAIHGVGYSVNQSATSIYGLSQSTYTGWDNQRLDATGFAADPFNWLQRMQLLCSHGQKGGRDRSMIDIFFCDQTDYRVICQSEFAKEWHEADLELLKAGFQNISAWGTPVVWSEAATAATIFGLNSKNFELVCAGPEMIDTGVEKLPGFPMLDAGYAVALHNLFNKNPRNSGVLYNTTS